MAKRKSYQEQLGISEDALRTDFRWPRPGDRAFQTNEDWRANAPIKKGFPILFNYRHFIELSIKDTIATYCPAVECITLLVWRSFVKLDRPHKRCIRMREIVELSLQSVRPFDSVKEIVSKPVGDNQNGGRNFLGSCVFGSKDFLYQR